MSLKQQFGRARQHINNGDYDKARKVLAEIDHPKATEWIVKIDKIAPPRQKAPLWPWLAAAAVIIALGIGVVIYVQDQNAIRESAAEGIEQTRQERAAYVELTLLIEDVTDFDQQTAGDIADLLIDTYPDEMITCVTAYDRSNQTLSLMECVTPYLEVIGTGTP